MVRGLDKPANPKEKSLKQCYLKNSNSDSVSLGYTCIQLKKLVTYPASTAIR